MKYKEAINKAIKELLNEEDLYILGQDIALWGGQGNILGKPYDKPERIIDTPISEASSAGVGIGLALTGKKVIIEYAFFDFILHSVDQIINNATKLPFFSNGKINLPVVFFATISSDRFYGATHSQSLEHIFMNIPGLKVVYPSNPTDAYVMLKEAVRSSQPTVFLVHKLLFDIEDTILREENSTKTRKVRSGESMTIVAYGRSIVLTQKALDDLNISNVDLIDLRYLNPIDINEIKDSVLKSKRLLVVEEGHGMVAESLIGKVATQLNELGIRYGKVHSKFSPIGLSNEKDVVVSVEDIKEGIKQLNIQ